MAKRARTKVKAEYYVDNKRLTKEIIEYVKKMKEAKLLGKDLPILNDYIGECILKIANRLAMRRNFINYTYREEFIGDGIENVIQYIANFDERKSSNAFGYITQILFFAFLRRIEREKKQAKIRENLMGSSGIFQNASTKQPKDERKYNDLRIEHLQNDFKRDREEKEAHLQE